MRLTNKQIISIPTVEGKNKPPSLMLINSLQRIINNPSFGYLKNRTSSFGVHQLNIKGDLSYSEKLNNNFNTISISKFLHLRLYSPEPVKIEFIIQSVDGRFLEYYIHNSYGGLNESIDLSSLRSGKHLLQVSVSNNNLDRVVFKRELIKVSCPTIEEQLSSVTNCQSNPGNIFRDRAKQILQRTALVGALALGSVASVFSQKHDLDFKVRELTNGTGANIQNVKVDIGDGKYIGYTDANGVAHIHDVADGTHRIKVSKPGYIQFTQDGYVLDGNKVFNASMINDTQTGPWGSVNFNVSWWRQTYLEPIPRNKDPPRWAQIAPINNRISSTPAYTYADSVNIVNAINELAHIVQYVTIKPSRHV